MATEIISTETLVSNSQGEAVLWTETLADGTVTINDTNTGIPLTEAEQADLATVVRQWLEATGDLWDERGNELTINIAGVREQAVMATTIYLAHDNTLAESAGITDSLDDVRYELYRSIPDGETYAVERVSVWDINDQCVGSRIRRFCGPLEAHADTNDLNYDDWDDDGELTTRDANGTFQFIREI